jgi:hypothetical protein
MSADSTVDGPAVRPVPGQVAEAAARAGFGGYLGAEASPRGGVMLAVLAVPLFAAGVASAATNRSVTGVAVGTGIAVLAGALFGLAIRVEGRPRRVIYWYEGGIVAWRAGHDVAVHPWSAVQVYEWIESGSTQSRSYQVLRVALRAEPDGLICGFGGDLASMRERIVQAERVAAMVAARETPRASASLAAGDPVVYGALLLTSDAVTVDGVTLPWSQVRRMELSDDRISIHRRGQKSRPVTVARKRTPHVRTLLALADARLAAIAPDADGN